MSSLSGTKADFGAAFVPLNDVPLRFIRSRGAAIKEAAIEMFYGDLNCSVSPLYKDFRNGKFFIPVAARPESRAANVAANVAATASRAAPLSASVADASGHSWEFNF